MIPVFTAKAARGQKCLIVGVANEHSIAWECAKAFRGLGAELVRFAGGDGPRRRQGPG